MNVLNWCTCVLDFVSIDSAVGLANDKSSVVSVLLKVMILDPVLLFDCIAAPSG